MPDPHPPQQAGHRCPHCRSRVKRVLRTSGDKRRWDADEFRRYRCRSDSCGWQGLLPVSGRHRRRAPVKGEASALRRTGLVALGALLAAALAWAGVTALQAMLDP